MRDVRVMEPWWKEWAIRRGCVGAPVMYRNRDIGTTSFVVDFSQIDALLSLGVVCSLL